MTHIHRHIDQTILHAIFILSLVYWLLFVIISRYQNHPLGIFTQFPIIIIPLYTGLLGHLKATNWGGLKSLMGRSLIGFSLALMAFGTGLLMWTYYIFTAQTIVYPSPADYIFVLCIIFWIIGLVPLVSIVGAHRPLRTIKGKLLFTATIIIVAAVSYFFQTYIAHGQSPDPTANPHYIFDFLYTFGNMIIIIIVAAAYNLSRHSLGGRYKRPILYIFAGQTVHYIAILFFTYSTTQLTYFNGNIADLLFTIALYLEGLGVICLDTKFMD